MPSAKTSAASDPKTSAHRQSPPAFSEAASAPNPLIRRQSLPPPSRAPAHPTVARKSPEAFRAEPKSIAQPKPTASGSKTAAARTPAVPKPTPAAAAQHDQTFRPEVSRYLFIYITLSPTGLPVGTILIQESRVVIDILL